MDDIQKIEITTDFVVEITINNSTVNTRYGMPVSAFIKIMEQALTPSIALVHLENVDGIGLHNQ